MYGPIAIMNKRKKNSGKKNPIQEFQEEKEISLEEQVEWLGKFWEILGIKGKPTKEDLLQRRNVELETVIMIKKYGK